jgi:hypothetical protein
VSTENVVRIDLMKESHSPILVDDRTGIPLSAVETLRIIVVLQRRVRGRIEFINGDRLLFILLYQWFPSVLNVMRIVQPETVVRGHRAGFRSYWRWKSRDLGFGTHRWLASVARRKGVEQTLVGRRFLGS